MKKYLILAVTTTLFFFACHKKTVPVIAERKVFPAAPKSDKATLAENTPEFIAAGKSIYESRCNRCHDLRSADVYTTERWASILKLMIPRARLNDLQAKQVTAYVSTNAKK